MITYNNRQRRKPLKTGAHMKTEVSKMNHPTQNAVTDRSRPRR
jgi:hypothetical protein